MELYIRSQDRQKFYKANEIYAESEIKDYKETGIYYIRVNEEWFATYKSKERALEVLDEIQNILMPKVLLNASTIKPVGDNFTIKNGVVIQKYSADARWEQPDTFVYEMPKD